jgi:hypothetical protein
VASDVNVMGEGDGEYRVVPSCVLTPAGAAVFGILSTQFQQVDLSMDLRDCLKETKR